MFLKNELIGEAINNTIEYYRLNNHTSNILNYESALCTLLYVLSNKFILNSVICEFRIRFHFHLFKYTCSVSADSFNTEE